MSDDNSEEKDLPATEHSLRKAREKGQVANSKDFVSMTVTIGAAVFVLFAWPQFARVFQQGMDFAIIEIGGDFHDIYRQGMAVTILQALWVLTPLVAVLIMLIVLSNVLHKQGVPFSMQPITPDFKRINPASGFKKMFGARGASEFGVALVKVALWFAVATLLVWQALPGLLISPVCDVACVANTSVDLLQKLLAAAAILLIFSGIIDLPLQIALFKRENRMSKTQLKRELKETMGTPEFKNFRKEAHRALQQGAPTRGGNSAATLVIAGGDIAIAVRFNAKDTPVPVVVARGRGALAETVLDSAAKLGIPVERQPALAVDLYRTSLPGQQISARLFQSVALLIVKNGLM